MGRASWCFLALAGWPSFAIAANLTVDKVWAHAPVIVYELPYADGRADAIHYVESMRDRFKPRGAVLDAAADRTSLKGKLKNGFVLYTTLGEKSQLLRLATAKLAKEVTGGEWSDPGGELRTILVGENPYSSGYCVIFAAGSNRALVGIHDVPHGSSSYHIFRGSQLLREGTYDDKFISTERISQAAALQDVHEFFRTLRRVHPNLLGKVTEDGYRALHQQTIAGVAAKLDSSGGIAVQELASLLAYAAARFQDGHTSVYWRTSLGEWNTRGKRFPAFRLFFDNGRFLVAAAKDRTIVGMEVIGVNGAPVLEFLRPILDRQSGETLAFRTARFLWNEPFWYYLTDLFGAGAPYLLRLRDRQGQFHEIPLETFSYPAYQAFRNEGGEEPFRPNHQGTRVEFFDSGATAHFLYSSFNLSAEEHKNVDRVFEEVKVKGARNLILDLRDNPGGQSQMAEQIFSYLYGGKFRSFRMVRAKVSWEILPQVPWWARPLLFVLRGRVISHSIGERAFHKPTAFFQGRSYLLIDNGSYSMAVGLAAMFRDYHVGTILGYETGGLPITFGGPYLFTLKNSGIPCSVAWTENFPPKPWDGDDQHGVIPDVPLSDQKLAEFQGEQDPVLAFALRYVQAPAR